MPSCTGSLDILPQLCQVMLPNSKEHMPVLATRPQYLGKMCQALGTSCNVSRNSQAGRFLALVFLQRRCHEVIKALETVRCCEATTALRREQMLPKLVQFRAATWQGGCLQNSSAKGASTIKPLRIRILRKPKGHTDAVVFRRPRVQDINNLSS